jgi:hydroxyethylthiazole kinase-like uncharacterized protein yjeF
MPVASAAAMRGVDAAAHATFGIAPRQLMEVAGFQVARVVDDWLHGAAGKRVAVIAGAGNNGGDALAAARFLAQRGGELVAWIVDPRDPESLAASHARTLRAMGIRCARATGTLDLDVDVILDGLLGTGIRAPLREPASRLIRAINDAGRPVIAIDLPSGLDSDSGAGDETAVQAAATVTLGLPKPALRRARSCGRLFLADIGLPAALFGAERPAVETLYRSGDLLELVSSSETPS